MARKPKGHDVVEKVKEELSRVRSADELRELQAVLLPLEPGLTIEETASALGRSIRWVTQVRNNYLQEQKAVMPIRPGKGGRRRQNLTIEDEIDFLTPFFEQAEKQGFLTVCEIHLALQEHLGREIPLSSVYNLLNRHGWRERIHSSPKNKSFAR